LWLGFAPNAGWITAGAMKQVASIFIGVLFAAAIGAVALGAQHRNAPPQHGSVPNAATETAITPVTTRRTITVRGTRLSYTARAGFIPILDEAAREVRAKLFFVSYTVDSKRGRPARPLTFVTAGGPPEPDTLDDDAGPRSLKADVPAHLPPPL